MKKIAYLLAFIFIASAFTTTTIYPIDGYEYTGIKRLKRLERIKNGEIKDNTVIPPGAMKSMMDIQLNLLTNVEDSVGYFLKPNEKFQKEINGLFGSLSKNYSISVLDITNLDSIRYAEKNPLAGYQPGSVGKIAVLVALFEQLANIYPDSYEDRVALLKGKHVKSGVWGLTDTHTVPIYDVEKNVLVKRQVIASDVFSLFEWADHMMSVSNNGAASIVWREALLMAAFGDKYPALTEEEALNYFKTTPKKELTDLGNDVVNLPLRKLGITSDEWRLGSFFTGGANTYVGDKGGSTGTTRGLMKFLVQMEQGKVVDTKSSLEMKRLMYMTDRRIRYAQSPSLKEAAVYFKSGSLYKCDRSKGEACGKYMGNVTNYMNSVAIVEHTDNTCYMVVLMSNVLRKNSASDHMALASSIDKIIRK
ncbi:serine hydrolase [Aureisphaera sp. CAU 1614]|uniref:Serine hydrolase n=1 Tax=Halomarinibacterium sedimenti TaxID=2857106 RepID=A0A9X1K0C1_9FLAO|nr:serine hydrolase [Halomarinibacterium sedimenti]MBW2938296.1 serine hydrolase [Halomarinibacterium sedimenti]